MTPTIPTSLPRALFIAQTPLEDGELWRSGGSRTMEEILFHPLLIEN
jgi:hypothetical protein